MIRFLLVLLMSILAVGLNGCTDSDKYLFDVNDGREIEVSAFMTRSFDDESPKVKQDTIFPGDSIIFFTSIYPSKSIRLQKYYWTINDKFFANEFSFKNTVKTPGIYNVKFILIDNFGDKLTDSLTLYVANAPKLDIFKIFPKNNSQNLDPNKILNFSWNNQNDDGLWQINYKFTLTKDDGQEILVDTLLHQPTFSYRHGLSPMEKYSWTVEAINDLGKTSEQSIQSTFYTAGYGNEGAIAGEIAFEEFRPTTSLHFSLLDTSRQLIHSFKNYTINESGEYYLKPIPSGEYLLVCALDSFPDFKPDTSAIKVRSSLVFGNGTITFADKTPPSIIHSNGNDTLDVADTLTFIVSDKGGNIKPSKIEVKLGSTSISKTQYRNDTLLVMLPSLRNSWTYKLLSISAQDQSGNSNTANFYIRPVTTLEEVMDD